MVSRGAFAFRSQFTIFPRKSCAVVRSFLRSLKHAVVQQAASTHSTGLSAPSSCHLVVSSASLMNAPFRYFRIPGLGVDAMSAQTTHSFPRHTHDQFGIGVVDYGVHASISGCGPVHAGAGDFICVNPGEVHDGRSGDQDRRAWRMLYLEPSTLQTLYEDVFEQPVQQFAFAMPVFTDASMRQWFDAVFASMSVSPDSPMSTETALLRLTAHLGRHGSRILPRRQGSTATVRRVRARIDADPATPVTLTELAREACLSRFQLLRAFARDVGLTPHAYIVQQRLARARRLIRANVSLIEAANACGFYDQSHFTRLFLRQFGVSPGRYAVPRL